MISGQWYFEVTIDEMQEPTATRIGWSQPLGKLLDLFEQSVLCLSEGKDHRAYAGQGRAEK